CGATTPYTWSAPSAFRRGSRTCVFSPLTTASTTPRGGPTWRCTVTSPGLDVRRTA
ncbi:MAG: hypothetical protein AVDCRST_MAG28-3399, partial [uncultured Rubrobacteraceae bacterium]